MAAQLDESRKQPIFSSDNPDEEILPLAETDYCRYFLKEENNGSEITDQLDPEKHLLLLSVSQEDLNETNKKNIRLTLRTHPHYFSSHSHQSIIQHFLLIIEKLTKYSDQSVTHFSFLTHDDREKLKKFSAPFTQPLTNPAVTIQKLFSEQVQKHPGTVAISWHDQIMSYQALDHLSNKIAHFLIAKKIRLGDRVAVMMERTPLLIACMIGIFKAQGVFVPLNPKYPDERIQYILEDCQPT